MRAARAVSTRNITFCCKRSLLAVVGVDQWRFFSFAIEKPCNYEALWARICGRQPPGRLRPTPLAVSWAAPSHRQARLPSGADQESVSRIASLPQISHLRHLLSGYPRHVLSTIPGTGAMSRSTWHSQLQLLPVVLPPLFVICCEHSPAVRAVLSTERRLAGYSCLYHTRQRAILADSSRPRTGRLGGWIA